MKADGSVIMDTKISTDGMEKGFERIKNDMDSVADAAEKVGNSIKASFSQIDVSGPIAQAKAKVESLEQQLASASAEYKFAISEDDDKSAEKLAAKMTSLYDRLEAARNKLANEVEKAANKQAAAEEKAAQKSIKASEKEAAAKSKAAQKQFNDLTSGARRFGARLTGILSSALVFNVLSSGLRNVTSYFGNALKSNNEFSNALAKLKGAFLTAFQPIYEYVIPAITRLIQWLTSAMQVLGQFLASLFGKSYSQMAKNAESLNKQANAIGGVGDAAKEASKQLMGFDELNRLESTETNTGGGGGGATAAQGANFENDDTLVSKIQTITNKIKEFAEYIPVIFFGLAGLKLGGLIADLATANVEAKTLKDAIKLLGDKLAIAGGITLAITGVALEGKGIYDALTEGLDLTSFGEILIGGGALTGGLSLALSKILPEITILGSKITGGLLGGAIGAIVAGIPAFITGVYDSIVNGIDWLSATLTAAGATAAGAGIGAIIGALGGPIGAGIGALIGLAVGLVTDLVILIVQKWDEICAFFAPAAEWFDTNIIQPVAGFFSGLWTSISSWASDCWNAIVDFFTPAVEWFSQLWGSVSQTFSDIFYNIGVIASGCWEIIATAWGIASDWFNQNVIQPVANFFSGMWEGLKSGAAQAWEGIKSVFSTVATFFGDIFRAAWEKVVAVFSPLGEIFINIKDGILTAFKAIVNGIISGLNQAIAIPFNGINSALMAIKTFSIFGITPFAGLREISVPQIPYLAQGAVIPPNAPFMAVLGDQRNGNNIEAPEDLIRKIVREEAGGVDNSRLEELLEMLISVVEGIEVGDEVIGRAAARYNRRTSRARGT